MRKLVILGEGFVFFEQFAMTSCRYWVQGRGCRKGTSCDEVHDQLFRVNNLCHRFGRGACNKGEFCNRLHEGPNTQQNGFVESRVVEPESDLTRRRSVILVNMRASLIECMQADKTQTSEDERAIKLRNLKARLHSALWADWPDMIWVNRKLYEDLEIMEEEYLAGHLG